jgi:hypothetical protein
MAKKVDNGGGDGGGNGGPIPVPVPPPVPPPFQPASYLFFLDSFDIHTTRAVDEDTDHVTYAVQVGNQHPQPITVHLGDVDDGHHDLRGRGLQFGPLLVPDPNTPISFNFQIINNGHDDDANIEQKATAAALALLAKVFSLSTPWTAVLGVIVDILGGIFFADCDGPVAVDQINLTGATLWAWTQGIGLHRETKHYPGTDSPIGCGDNSSYDVTWGIQGTGVVPLPAIGLLQGGVIGQLVQAP